MFYSQLEVEVREYQTARVLFNSKIYDKLYVKKLRSTLVRRYVNIPNNNVSMKPIKLL